MEWWSGSVVRGGGVVVEWWSGGVVVEWWYSGGVVEWWCGAWW